MIKTKSQVYGSRKWKKKSLELRRAVGKCEICGSRYHLIVHHLIPLQWKDDKLEFESWSEIIDVPLQVLCHSCHRAKEESGDVVDYAHLFANELI